MSKSLTIPIERIQNAILFVRGEKVILDSDLARLYAVPTKSLNLAVKRNLERFPSDFMFQLTTEEVESLRFQFGTSKTGRGAGVICHMFSLSKGSRCSQAYSTASVQSWSTLKSCVRS